MTYEENLADAVERLTAERDLLATEHAAALQHVQELQEQLLVATRVARDAEDALCVLRARLS